MVADVLAALASNTVTIVFVVVPVLVLLLLMRRKSGKEDGRRGRNDEVDLS
jgi:hypothetical protein